MDDSTFPRSERKRPHEHHDADGRRVRKHGNEYGHGTYVRGRRSRSPRRSEHSGRRDSYTRETALARDTSHTRRRHGDARDDRQHETGHGDNINARHRPTGSRSRSPARRHRHSHRHRSHHASKASFGQDHTPPELPCNARPLSRSADFDAFRPLFARYLDVQKQIDIATLDEREVRGRWKSFVSKWNNCELAEGWYRPETFEDAMFDARGASDKPEDDRRHNERRRGSFSRREVYLRPQNTEREDEMEENDDDDDDYGPTLPTQEDPDRSTRTAKTSLLSQTKHGASIPSLSDLTLRRELEASDRDDARALLRHERKADRAQQKERLEELAPRADAGTAARRLEKRREVRDANAAFANAKLSSNEMAELGDAELLGGDGDGGGGGGLEEYKRLKREAERKKTEREIRREEIWRAKKEEREIRAREYREREASTVDMLREIAKSRFG
ncbi:hypothetical protein F5Y09DRAFT_281168 [Xylaria sp. FL1042]|nr:hypothetical protein F5Y09DRAFT_281168 [Xylaria sp. FL1042]